MKIMFYNRYISNNFSGNQIIMNELVEKITPIYVMKELLTTLES